MRSCLQCKVIAGRMSCRFHVCRHWLLGHLAQLTIGQISGSLRRGQISLLQVNSRIILIFFSFPVAGQDLYHHLHLATSQTSLYLFYCISKKTQKITLCILSSTLGMQKNQDKPFLNEKKQEVWVCGIDLTLLKKPQWSLMTAACLLHPMLNTHRPNLSRRLLSVF